MITIPNEFFTKYTAYLKKSGVPVSAYAEYKKWLRYYLDFCDKYPVPEAKSERVRLFAEKLRDKKQSPAQRQCAANAVSLYFQMEKEETGSRKETLLSRVGEAPPDYVRVKQYQDAEEPAIVPRQFRRITRTSNFNEAGYQEKSDSPEWDAVLEALAGEIKVRHYSRKTLKTHLLQ